MEDGTVIGTYAWIDDAGYLRQRDYIADNAGYRILKSKNLYVGRDMPVGQAVLAAKKLPADAGVLVKTVKASPTTKPLPPVSYPVLKSTTPLFGYPADVSRFTPQVDILPNSIPSSTEVPLIAYSSPSTTVLPPRESSTIKPEAVYLQSPPSSTPPTVYIPSTTPDSIPFESSTRRFVTTTTQYSEETFRTGTIPIGSTPNLRTGPPDFYIAQPTSPTLPPPIQSNSLDYYSGAPQYEHYSDNTPNPYIFQNGPTYPLDKNGRPYTGRRSAAGNRYDSQYQKYDGVSVTNDGFRYYIPRAYHEEQNVADDKKSGSFGYIDPFGIRRVIYYNASPEEGFQHRKNNRYVGFDATPYDPRPT